MNPKRRMPYTMNDDYQLPPRRKRRISLKHESIMNLPMKIGKIRELYKRKKEIIKKLKSQKKKELESLGKKLDTELDELKNELSTKVEALSLCSICFDECDTKCTICSVRICEDCADENQYDQCAECGNIYCPKCDTDNIGESGYGYKLCKTNGCLSYCLNWKVSNEKQMMAETNTN